MAIDSNSLTLAEYLQYTNDPLIQNAIFSLYGVNSVLGDTSFDTDSTMVRRGSRFRNADLPTVNWRKLNEEPPVVSGAPEQFSESVYIMANNIDTDIVLLADRNNYNDTRSSRFNLWWWSTLYDVNDKFINNNHATGDPDAIVGIRERLDDPTTWGVESGLKVDGGGVVMTDALTSTSANDFFGLIQDTLYEMGNPNGDGCVMYVNQELDKQMARAIRLMGAASGWTTQMDNFDRPVLMYRNMRISVIGRKKDGTTQIITNTETASGADGASTFTSFYIVRYGETYAKSWQMRPLSITDLGILNNGMINRIAIGWEFGYTFEDTRSMARGFNIKTT